MSDMSSNALHNCAVSCALNRKNGTCKHKFGDQTCIYCRHYIGRYVEADHRQLELFMYQADLDAARMKNALRYARLNNLIIIGFIVCIIAACFWARQPKKGQNSNLSRYNEVTTTVYKPTTHDHIEAALWKVAKDIKNKVDVNYNGKSNCEDAAILFYQYYAGNKADVCIMSNDNQNTDMYHAFNCVYIDGVWRAIEPQAYHLGWSTYYMRDIWGSKYDSSKNKDAWNDYGRFVKY